MENTIKFRVYFFTDNMAEDGSLVPKKAWEQGKVVLVKNVEHGIPERTKMFHHYEEIKDAIEALAKENGVEIYRGKFSKDKGKRLV